MSFQNLFILDNDTYTSLNLVKNVNHPSLNFLDALLHSSLYAMCTNHALSSA